MTAHKLLPGRDHYGCSEGEAVADFALDRALHSRRDELT
jgi:hypothetical protein